MEYHKTILHYHGYISAATELLDTLRSKGISILALTGSNRDLFNNLLRNDEFRPYIKDVMDHQVAVLEYEDKEFYFVRGCEYHCWNPEKMSGHLLSLGHNQELSFTKPDQRRTDYSILDVGKEIRDKNGIVVAAHPFTTFYSGGLNRKGLDNLLKADLLDALEFNGQLPKILEHLFKFNERAKKFAAENDLPIIATPDAHLLKDIDCAYFKLPIEQLDTSTSDEFMKSLKDAIKLSKVPTYPREPNHLYEKLNYEGYISMMNFVNWQTLHQTGRIHRKRWLLYSEQP